MTAKKNIVLVMNCAAEAIVQYLSSSESINSRYSFSIATTYTSIDDSAAKERFHILVSNADVVISQDVQNVDWLRNDYIARLIKKNCEFIRLAFWRFDGYWPIKLPRSNNSMFYYPDEFGPLTCFNEYIAREVDKKSINDCFESEFEKFSLLEAGSDLKMFDFVYNNHKKHRLFSDNWHPTSYFFYHVAAYIIDRLGFAPDISVIPTIGLNKDRFRFILTSVHNELDLDFDQNILPAYEYYVTSSAFFEFSKYAKIELATANDVSQAAECFGRWMELHGLREMPVNVAIWAQAQQSSRSVWSANNEPMSLVIGSNPAPFSFHTNLEHEPWVLIDLKEIRAIDSMTISNRADGCQDKALPLKVTVSNNLSDWTELALINYDFGSVRTGGKPIRMDFQKPISAKYVKLSVPRLTYFHLDNIEISSKVVVM